MSCGSGQMTRSRSCNGGVPGIAGCIGDTVEEMPCMNQVRFCKCLNNLFAKYQKIKVELLVNFK